MSKKLSNIPVLNLFCLLLFVMFSTRALSSDNTSNTIVKKVSDIQVLGSHNSYKKLIQPELYKLLATKLNRDFSSLEYRHPNLEVQLSEFKLRNLELDVLYDPKGGRYSFPAGHKWLAQHKIPAETFDPNNELAKPGFKVLHIPDIDFSTHCYLLKQCLRTLRKWSLAHPDHLPISITFNAKTDNFDHPDLVTPLAFDKAAFDALDQEFKTHLGEDLILTPDMVRGDFPTLQQAVLTKGWPSLDRAKGKFILVLDESSTKNDIYLDGHDSLKNRIMFVSSPEQNDEAAFMIINEPRENLAKIKNLVKKGFVIRTRADAGTTEARENDYSRLKAAVESGAQYITTDYYRPEPLINKTFVISLDK